MSLTIDRAGRLVIPKGIRDAAGITPGSPLEVRLRDGVIEISPATVDVELVEKDGIVVARAAEGTPPMPAEVVEEVLNQLRSERG